MGIRDALATTFASVAVPSCGDEPPDTAPTPPAAGVLLRAIGIARLPSPCYHFEYDATRRVSRLSFASGLRVYEVAYDADRITEVRSNMIVNHDKLVYVYNGVGRIAAIKHVDETGLAYAVLFFAYAGQKLVAVERDRKVTGGFTVDKRMTFSYYADGNLRAISEHRPAIDGYQDETTTTDRFEHYDDGINVDAFSLLHGEFFDHVVLLPGVQVQTGNPGRVTHTGDGINYRVDYTYTYDGRKCPLIKAGDATWLNGPNSGEKFETRSVFSYY